MEGCGRLRKEMYDKIQEANPCNWVNNKRKLK